MAAPLRRSKSTSCTLVTTVSVWFSTCTLFFESSRIWQPCRKLELCSRSTENANCAKKQLLQIYNKWALAINHMSLPRLPKFFLQVRIFQAALVEAGLTSGFGAIANPTKPLQSRKEPQQINMQTEPTVHTFRSFDGEGSKRSGICSLKISRKEHLQTYRTCFSSRPSSCGFSNRDALVTRSIQHVSPLISSRFYKGQAL